MRILRRIEPVRCSFRVAVCKRTLCDNLFRAFSRPGGTRDWIDHDFSFVQETSSRPCACNYFPGSLKCCALHPCQVYKRSLPIRHTRNHIIHPLSVKPELRSLKLLFKAIHAYISLYIITHDRESREMKCSTCPITHHQSQNDESVYTSHPHWLSEIHNHAVC